MLKFKKKRQFSVLWQKKTSSAITLSFNNTSAAGGYEGVRFWTSFQSLEHFKQNYSPANEPKVKVLAEGVTKEKAAELCAKTPLDALACIGKAGRNNQKNGRN